MKNNQLIILTEENVTAELVDLALNSTKGVHWDSSSSVVSKMVAEGMDRILKKLR